MAIQSTTLRWLRLTCALLAIAGVWALSQPAMYVTMERPSSWFILASGLFGLYLFGYFAIRGRLPEDVMGDDSEGGGAGGDA